MENTTKLTIMEYLKPLDHKFLSHFIQQNACDRYIKKFHCKKALKLFVFAQLLQIPSYRKISLKLRSHKKLQKTIGLSSISTSQLSRTWRDLDSAWLESFYHHIKNETIKRLGLAKAGAALKGLQLIDSSLITFTLSRYRWATYSKFRGGVKLHLRYIHSIDESVPDEAIMTTGNCSDKTKLEELVSKDPEVLNVFDRGYIDYRLFDQYTEESVRFVTRLRHNADYKIIEDHPVDPKTGIQRDAVVWLGYRGTRYRMKKRLRMVECLDNEGNPFRVITNDFDMSAQEIADVYRKRWQIELFFKWIKQHLHVKRCYGTSKNAVFNQVYTALITYCLIVLTRSNLGTNKLLIELQQHVVENWDKSWRDFMTSLFRPPERTSKGRRKSPNVEHEFQLLLQNMQTEDVSFFYETNIDPLHE